MATVVPAHPPDFVFWYRAKCMHVIDGDTITVATDLGFRLSWEQRIRLYRINTPELNDPDARLRELAVEARKHVIARIWDQNVILHTFKDSKDKYGRWLAEVYYRTTDGSWTSLNQEILEKGLGTEAKY